MYSYIRTVRTVQVPYSYHKYQSLLVLSVPVLSTSTVQGDVSCERLLQLSHCLYCYTLSSWVRVRYTCTEYSVLAWVRRKSAGIYCTTVPVLVGTNTRFCNAFNWTTSLTATHHNNGSFTVVLLSVI